MKIRFTLFLVILIGCATKNENDPTTPVLNFYRAMNAGDTAAILNVWTSEVREHFRESADSTFKMATQLKLWGKTKAEVKIREVKMDSNFPNLATVHFSVNFTGEHPASYDSVNLHVIKENGDWKLSSLQLQKDNQ